MTRKNVVFVTHLEVRAVPRGGGAPHSLGSTPCACTLFADDESVYWATEQAVMRWRGGEPEVVLPRAGVDHIAETKDYLVLAGSWGLARVAVGKQPPKLLFGGRVTRLVAEGRHAYVATDEYGGIALRRIRLEDGELRLLARLPHATTMRLALTESHLFYVDDKAAVVRRLDR